jgi:hypothetical protein
MRMGNFAYFRPERVCPRVNYVEYLGSAGSCLVISIKPNSPDLKRKRDKIWIAE